MDGALTQTTPDRTTIGDLLRHWAEIQPDKAAILAPGRKPLTFAGLYAQLEYVRGSLAAWGIGPGDAVAVLLPKGPEMAATIATLPVSATAVPLDPNLSVSDYQRLFQRCSARALIRPRGQTHAACAVAGRAGLLQIELISDANSPAGEFELAAAGTGQIADSRGSLGPETAYILCTSGTTSQRKLIPSRHDNIIAYAKAMKAWYRLSPADVSIHLTPMYFASGVCGTLVVPLMNGASIVFPPSYQADSFFALLDEYRPTWFAAGFTIYRDILRNVDRYRQIAEATRLRFMKAGSGRLEPDEIRRVEKAFDAPVIVALSSSETSWITVNPLPPRRRKIDSVGVPTANEVRIRDESGRFVSTGEEGEIVVRGPLVFRGYLDDPVANEQAFVDGWYRTGDWGKFDEDGYLYLTGRIKEIINCGGEKISPVEIDGVLESHPAVAEGAAFAVPHPTLGEVVVAAVVLVSGAEANEKDIRKHVRSHLAAAKVPRRIFFVDCLPRTEGGKLQRQKLQQVVARG